MFEDEMTEEHMVRTAEEYYRLNEQELHEEKIAVMRGYIAALEGIVCALKRQRHQDTMALLAMPLRNG